MQRINKIIISETKELHKKSVRDKLQKTIVEGFNALSVAISSNQKILYAIVDNEKIIEKFKALTFGKSKQFEIYIATPEELLKCSSTTTSYEVVTVIETPQIVKIFEKDYISQCRKLEKPVFAYDNIQDPGNLGTIIRTAAAFGLNEIWLVGECVDPFSPKVLRSSSGFAFFLHSIYQVSLNSFLHYFLLNKESSLIAVTKSNSEKTISLPHNNTTFNIMKKKDSVYVFGNEGHGLSHSVLDKANYHLSIQHDSIVDSLNVSIVTSIVAYELYSLHCFNNKNTL